MARWRFARGRSALLAVTAGFLALAFIAGCSPETREKVLPYFFDLPGREQKPQPPTQRVRRDLLREIEQLKRELDAARRAAKAGERAPADAQLPVERAKTWEEAASLMPRDSAGHVDWVQALQAGAIAPRPGPDPKTPAQAVLDLDAEFASSGSPLFRATFSHTSHTAWLACASCHPAVFPLKRLAAPVVITMAKIEQRQYCGACHGTVAFGLKGRCARCHPAIPARAEWRPGGEPRRPIERATSWQEAMRLLPLTDDAPDWSKALAQGVIAPRPGLDPKATDEEPMDLDVARVPKDGAEYKVVFRHATHTAWLACASCHPQPFKEEAGATPMSMDAINAGRSCGVCHGKVAFPADACARCHPAMGGG